VQFNGERAYASVVQQVALGPRITGSAPNRQLGDQILTQLASSGWVTRTQEFTYQETPVRNLIGIKGTGSEVVILGAHYDTRRRADQDQRQPNQPVPGANDGASGAAVLLELSRVLDVAKTGKQVWLVFFDAEDNGELDGWDWIVGSRYFAQNLVVTPTATVIVDMVGDRQQELYLEQASTSDLAAQIWDVAQRLGYGDQFKGQEKWNMLDDHTPFLQRGLRAVDIIDFDYPYWHTTQDTPDKVSPESLERVGRTLQYWLESGP
jgi:glutaminyl-peptide cyclotransferase